MNISGFAQDDRMFADCEHFRGNAFIKAISWVKCALLPVICARFGLSQDSCAHFSRIECLLPTGSTG